MDIMERIKLWFRSLHYQEIDNIVDEYKEKGQLKDALINVTVTALVPAVMSALQFLIVGFLFGSLLMGLFGGIGTIMGAIAIVVITVILSPILFLLFQGVCWALATKIFHGSGSYKDQCFIMSFPTAAMSVLNPIFVALSFIPCVGYLVTFVYAFYPLFIHYKIIKRLHKLETLPAIAVIAIPILLVLIIVAVLFFVMMGAIMAGLGSLKIK